MKYKAGTIIKCKSNGKIWRIVNIDNIYITVKLHGGKQYKETYNLESLDSNFIIINRLEKLERILNEI